MSELRLIGCPFCNGRVEETSFSVSAGRKGAKVNMKAVCKECGTTFGISTELNPGVSPFDAAMKKFNTRKPIDDMVEQIHNAGGCDGTTDYDKGWDDAMAAAEKIVRGGAT